MNPPEGPCLNCGQGVARCRDGCNWPGWYHVQRLADLPASDGLDAHWCDSAKVTVAVGPT